MLVHEVGKLSYKNLKNLSFVKKPLQLGLLSVHLWNFNIGSGIITEYDEDTKNFKPLILKD
jgi:carbonic anhydrase